MVPGSSVAPTVDNAGAIEANKLADIIAVPGDPLKDTSQLLHVGFVMKSGQLVYNDR